MNIATFLRITAVLVFLCGPHRASAGSTLYDALGQQPGITAFVNDATARWASDRRIAATFDNTNMTRLSGRIVEQICALSDGPCRYKGHDMRRSHQGMHISQAQFNALAEDLQDAMDHAGVAYGAQNRLLALLAPMQRDVVGQ